MADASKRELLDRLSRLGPLPDDDAITQAQLDEFGDVIDRIEKAPPDTDYIRPLLAAFGAGDGFALYTHGASALLRQDRAALIAAAVDALEAGPDGPRRWALETRRKGFEGDANPSATARESRAVEAALTGPPAVATAAVWWAYWLGGDEGRRLLGVAARVAPAEARELSAELERSSGRCT